MEKLNLNYEIVKDQFKELISESNDGFEEISSSSTYEEENDDNNDDSIEQNPFTVKSGSSKSKKSKTPVLDNFEET